MDLVFDAFFGLTGFLYRTLRTPVGAMAVLTVGALATPLVLTVIFGHQRGIDAGWNETITFVTSDRGWIVLPLGAMATLLATVLFAQAGFLTRRRRAARESARRETISRD